MSIRQWGTLQTSCTAATFFRKNIMQNWIISNYNKRSCFNADTYNWPYRFKSKGTVSNYGFELSKLLKLRIIIFVVRICNICAKSVWPLTTCCRAAVTFLKGVKCPWIALNTWQMWQVQKYRAILATLVSKEVSSDFYEDSRNF